MTNPILNAFTDELIMALDPASLLHLNTTLWNVFTDFDGRVVDSLTTAEDLPADKSYDLIFVETPFGRKNSVEWSDDISTFSTEKNWLDLLKCLMTLSPEGRAVYLGPPVGFSYMPGPKFEKELNNRGFCVSALFQAPERLLYDYARIIPSVIILGRKSVDHPFTGEMTSEEQTRNLVKNFLQQNDTKTLSAGMVLQDDFVGFSSLKAHLQIGRLKSQYKNYEHYTLVDLMVEVNAIREGQHEPNEKAIYIPRVGNSDVIANLSKARIKHHNLYQVILKENVPTSVVAAYFNSEIGKITRASLARGAVIKKLNKRDVEKLDVALPSLPEQKQIAKAIDKLHQLSEKIEEFEKELALNPPSSREITDKLDDVLDVLGALTDADKVRAVARRGEDKVTEYKSTFRLNLHTNQDDKKMEFACLRTIAGFLNFDGGTLLVGVDDHGKLLGLQNEIDKFHKGSRDDYLLRWKNKIKTSVGEQCYPLIHYRLVNINTAPILMVVCKPSSQPIFIKEKFYARTNPATDELLGPQLIAYIKNHFEQVIDGGTF